VKRSCDFHQTTAADFSPLVEELVARYAAVGLVDDAVFARARVLSLRRQGLSRQAILAKLQAKGLTKAQIEEALHCADEGQEEPETAAALAYARRKKLGRWRKKPQDPQKELAALSRAGFSYEVARRALNHREED
jgi:regulatory protein